MAPESLYARMEKDLRDFITSKHSEVNLEGFRLGKMRQSIRQGGKVIFHSDDFVLYDPNTFMKDKTRVPHYKVWGVERNYPRLMDIPFSWIIPVVV